MSKPVHFFAESRILIVAMLAAGWAFMHDALEKASGDAVPANQVNVAREDAAVL